MNKIYITDDEVKGLTQEVIRQLVMTNFVPELVVGLARGGLVPAVYISQFFDCEFYALNKQEDFPELEDYVGNILIVDDINDTGKTFTDVNNDVSMLGIEVRYAALLDNAGSDFTVDYYGREIDKVKDPSWIVYPWETWWQCR
jgi:hypoxanthine phosphoribosyltransferase